MSQNEHRFVLNIKFNPTYEEIDEEKYRSVAIWIATQRLVYNLTSHENYIQTVKKHAYHLFRSGDDADNTNIFTFSSHNHAVSSAWSKGHFCLRWSTCRTLCRFVSLIFFYQSNSKDTIASNFVSKIVSFLRYLSICFNSIACLSGTISIQKKMMILVMWSALIFNVHL